MKIFLTGATGFIGSHFLSHPSHSAHEVTALRRSGSETRVKLNDNPQWIDKEMDKLEVSDLAGHEVLVHLAAVGISPRKATWEEMMYWNVTVLMRLLEVALAAGLRRVVIAGTFAEYGRSGEKYEYIPPDAPLKPTNGYAASKAAGCITASAFAIENGLELCYLRIFSAYGDGQHPDNIWPSLREAAMNGNDFMMTGGAQIRDFISVDAVANALWFAVERDNINKSNPAVINIGKGIGVTLREFAEKWWKEWNATGTLKFGAVAYRPNEVMRYVAKLQD